MFTILSRAFVLYIVMVFCLRAMGKRQLGQFQPYELAMALLIAELLATPMADVSTPLLHGLIPVLIVIAVHGIIALICLKSDKARAVISGKPSVLVSGGVINEGELVRLCLSLSDLLEGVRESGILDPSDMECAVMEANGKITAFPRSEKRPATTSEMGIDTDCEGIPLALIMDGRIQTHNLKSAGMNEAFLKSLLSPFGLTEKKVYLATLSTQNTLTIQEKGGRIHKIQVNPSDRAAL